jgi:hypothetical protein
MSIYITTQFLQGAKSTSTTVREITNKAFIFNTKYKNSLKGLYESYGGLFDWYDDFCGCLQTVTKQKHHCLVFDNSVDELSENYLDHIAPEHVPEFRVKSSLGKSN